MPRAKLQLVSVLSLLPLGLGLCLLCLGEPERLAEQARARPAQVRTLAAPIVAPPGAPALAPDAAEEEPREGLTRPLPREALRGPAQSHSNAAPLAPLALPPSEARQAPRAARARLSPVQREALLRKLQDAELPERERLAAVIALAANPESSYVPELFREAFPDAPLEELAPGPIADHESRQALTRALRAPAASVAERALLVAALGPSQGYPEVASALEAAFTDPSPEVRGQVVIELAVSEEPSAGDLLRRAAEDPSAEVRLRAVLALGADPAEQATLAAAYDLEGQDREVKAAIVLQASEHAGTPQGAEFLTRVLREESDSGLRAEALAALAVAAEADPSALRAAAGPELRRLLERAQAEAGVAASADAERVLRVLRVG